MSTITKEKNPNIRGDYPPRLKMFAADNVEITPDMIGRRVEFQAYEGYQGYQTLKGVGVIKTIDYQFGTVTVEMPFKRNVYGRGGFLVGCDNLLTMSSSYDSGLSSGKPEGRYMHYESHGYQFDYPITSQHIFRILPEET